MNKHLPQLDGLRGVALLIVFLGHLVVFPFGLGIKALGPVPPIGVDLFFVLSGFLITGILLKSKSGPHYFKNFYARRALRIWPLYFLVLVFLFALTNHRVASLSFDEQRLHWWVFALYIQNLYFKQAAELATLALGVTWSLAVEEQFYTIWPFVVSKLSVRALAAFLVCLLPVAIISRVIMPHFGIDPYINPLCRFDAMAIGGLASLGLGLSPVGGGKSKQTILRILASVLACVALTELICRLLAIATYIDKTLASICFAVLLVASLQLEWLKTLLSGSWLRFTGKISYCLYLSHPIIATVVFAAWPDTSLKARIARSLVIFAGTYLVATASWTIFEKPILRLKAFFPEAEPRQVRQKAVSVSAPAPDSKYANP